MSNETNNLEKIYKDMRKAGWTNEDIISAINEVEDKFIKENEEAEKLETAREDFLYCFETYMKELLKDDDLDFSDMIDNLRRDFRKLEKTITTVQKKEQQKVKNKKSDKEVMKEFFKVIGLE